jgi:hypothetical protein
MVGKISSNSSAVGSDGRTRIMRGILLRVFWRRSWLVGRVMVYRIKLKTGANGLFLRTDAQATTML